MSRPVRPRNRPASQLSSQQAQTSHWSAKVDSRRSYAARGYRGLPTTPKPSPSSQADASDSYRSRTRRRDPRLTNGPLKRTPNTDSLFWRRAGPSAVCLVASEHSSHFATCSPTMESTGSAVGTWQPWGEWWRKIFETRTRLGPACPTPNTPKTKPVLHPVIVLSDQTSKGPCRRHPDGHSLPRPCASIHRGIYRRRCLLRHLWVRHHGSLAQGTERDPEVRHSSTSMPDESVGFFPPPPCHLRHSRRLLCRIGSASGNNAANDGRWAAIFLANYHFWSQGTSYFGSLLPPSPLQNFWSLAVEEQFYIVYPTIFLLCASIGGRISFRCEWRSRLGRSSSFRTGTRSSKPVHIRRSPTSLHSLGHGNSLSVRSSQSRLHNSSEYRTSWRPWRPGWDLGSSFWPRSSSRRRRPTRAHS